MSFKYAELYTQTASGHAEENRADEALLRSSACASTRTEAFFAHGGSVHIYDEKLQSCQSFATFPEVKFIEALRNGKLVVVLGSSNASELVSSTCVGFWSNSTPGSEWKCLLEFQPFKSQQVQEAAVTAWSVSDQGDKVSVVLALHASPCVIMQQDFRIVTSIHSNLKVSRVKTGRRMPIDNLNDRPDGRITNVCVAGGAENMQLFLTTESRVLTMDNNGFTTLDTMGASPGCFAAYESDKTALAWPYTSSQSPSTPGAP